MLALRQYLQCLKTILAEMPAKCYSLQHMPIKIIAIANQKGGTAKTTTTAAIAVLLSRGGISVHMVDMDPQASLTRAFGLTDSTDRLYNALSDRAGLPIDAVAESLTLTPSTVELCRAETELLTEPGKEYFLRTCLEKSRLPDNTWVLLDCPPSLGVLAVNCLAAAGGLLTVVQPGGFELHALVHLHMTVEAIQERLNPDLHVLGAVITNAHRRRRITDQVGLEVGRVYPVLGTVRTDARLLAATSSGKLHRLTTSKALEDYAQVVAALRTVVS
jgi:chromosome partitioning protein